MTTGNRTADGVHGAWTAHVPDVTVEEVTALLPIVQRGHGRLRGLVLAYRAGVAAATPPAPICERPGCPHPMHGNHYHCGSCDSPEPTGMTGHQIRGVMTCQAKGTTWKR